MHLIAIFNRKIKISLRRDRAELFVCIGIAAVFWFLVKLSQDYETRWDFSFEYVLPEQQAFIQKPPEKINATVSGSGWRLMYYSLFHTEQTLVFDLQALPLSVLERRLVIDRLQASLTESKLKVIDINLDYIQIIAGTKDSKRLPVRLQYQVNLEPQHRLVSPMRVIPDSVLVTGPASLLDSLQYWPTDSGNIGPLKASHTEIIPLAGQVEKVLDLDVEAVELKVEVEPIVEKTIYYVPVTAVNAPDSIRIFPASVTVYCVVGMSAYQSLGPGDFEVEADLNGIVPSTAQNTVPLNLTCAPDFVTNVRFTPQSVEFFIQKGGGQEETPASE